MKKDLKSIFPIISCGVAVICLFQISVLKSEINRLESSINSQISGVNSSINSIYSNVDRRLDEGSGFISVKNYEYKEFDAENGTVDVFVNIMPKQFDGNKTKTAIYVDDNKYEMSLKDGNYVAEIKIPLFEDTHISKIEFTDGSMIRNESVDWYLSPADDFFPYIYANLSGTWKNKYDGYDMEGNVNIDIDATSSELPEFSDFSVVETINGKVINKEKINVDIIHEDEYSVSGYFDISKEREIPQNSEYRIYLAIEDENGFVYVSCLDAYERRANGGAAHEEISPEANIYNKKGKLLYRRA